MNGIRNGQRRSRIFADFGCDRAGAGQHRADKQAAQKGNRQQDSQFPSIPPCDSTEYSKIDTHDF